MLQELKYYMRVGLKFMKLSILSALEYPVVLIGWGLANPVQFIVGFATIRFVVEQFNSLSGWGYEELAFLYGIAVLSHGLSIILFIQTWFVGSFVIQGEFDVFRLRPMSVLYQFLVMNFNLVGISDLIPGIIVFLYGCIKVHFDWNIFNILSIFGVIIGGTMIRGAVWIICGSISFWTKSTGSFISFSQEIFDRTTMYPLTMYPQAIQFIFTIILPFGWISFYPAGEFLGKGAAFQLPINFQLMTLLIGVLSISLACAFFCLGIKRYESSGT